MATDATAVESLSEMSLETLAESRIEYEEVVVEVIRFHSSDGKEVDVISDLAERSKEVQERLQHEDGKGYVQVDFNFTAIQLSIKWHFYTRRHLGTWDDDSNSIPPARDDWISRHFSGLDGALTWHLFRAAEFFKLRGLHHIIYIRMIPTIPWPWESDEYNTASSPFEVCFHSSDGREIYVVSDLAKKSPEAKSRMENPPEDGMGHIQVNFTFAAIQLSIKWFLYSQRVLDTWDNESASLPPGRDEWVRRSFLGLDKDLMPDVLRAAEYFQLRGLHSIVSNDMKARNLMATGVSEER